MHRVLFEIGGFKVYSFGAVVLAAFAAALIWGRSRAARYGYTAREVVDAAFWTLLIGIVGSRVTFILQDLPYFLEQRDELFSLQFKGLTSFGGLLFGAVFLVLFARKAGKSPVALLDLAAAPVLLAHAIGRVGCLLNGCCYGGPSDLPWAISVEDRLGGFHPAQIYDSLFTLAGLAALLALERRGLARGQGFALGIAFYGIARFIYEFWRAGFTSTFVNGLPLTEAHFVAGAMVLVGASLALWFGRRAAVSKEQLEA